MEDQILSKLNELIQKINSLELEVKQLRSFLTAAPLLQDPNACIDQFGHDYPMPWFGTFPPNCKKCGKQAPMPFITYTTDKTNGAPDFNQFGGNMMFTNVNVTTNDSDDNSNNEDDIISSYGR